MVHKEKKVGFSLHHVHLFGTVELLLVCLVFEPEGNFKIRCYALNVCEGYHLPFHLIQVPFGLSEPQIVLLRAYFQKLINTDIFRRRIKIFPHLVHNTLCNTITSSFPYFYLTSVVSMIMFGVKHLNLEELSSFGHRKKDFPSTFLFIA